MNLEKGAVRLWMGRKASGKKGQPAGKEGVCPPWRWGPGFLVTSELGSGALVGFLFLDE